MMSSVVTTTTTAVSSAVSSATSAVSSTVTSTTTAASSVMSSSSAVMLSGITISFAFSALCGIVYLITLLVTKELTSSKYGYQQGFIANLNKIVAVPALPLAVILVLTILYKTLIVLG